jgi:two-component system sensor histidine kinase DesK
MSPALQVTAAPSNAPAQPVRWWPMVFSVFGLLIPNGLILRGGVSPFEWLMAVLGAGAFVTLCAVAVFSWQRHRPFLWAVGLMVALGVGYTPVVFSGTVFFVLAAHVLPWAVGGNLLRAALYGSGLAMLMIFGSWAMPEYELRWINLAIYFALTTVGQVWVVRLCMNLRRLAAGAERERIADDLHDLLGDALSRITLKAQFAGQLLDEDGDCARARSEIAGTERISREALADVRQTIRKYREESRKEQRQANVGG